MDWMRSTSSLFDWANMLVDSTNTANKIDTFFISDGFWGLIYCYVVKATNSYLIKFNATQY